MLKRVARGQTLVETALVMPWFLMVIFGIVILGMGVFYQQQIANAAREGARYAAVHSATAQCPTVSNLEPDPVLLPAPNSYYACDAPSGRWPFMAASAREAIFGLPADGVRTTACWSGYWTKNTSGGWAAHDQVAIDPLTGDPNEFRDCTVPVWGWLPCQDRDATAAAQYVIYPQTGLSRDAYDCGDGSKPQQITIDCTQPFPLTNATNDMASSYAKANAGNSNQVSVVTCFDWQPPLAGFLLIPRHVTLHAAVVEGMQYQQ